MECEATLVRYTGNPYVDAGVAVLELRLRKPCSEFTDSDLADQAGWVEKEYRKKIWKSYLMLHLPNCAWTQVNPDSEKNRTYIRTVLESYKADFPDLGQRCAFCGRPAKVYADRRYVPLLTGETIMVAGAGGHPGLPVCGYCVLAVHFYPFATLKVEGRPLFWWAPDPRWMLRLNRYFYGQVQKLLAASGDDLPKLRWPATRLLHAARQAIDEVEKLPDSERDPFCDIVGIHATNYGTAANYDELRIPRGLLEFWGEAGTLGDLYRRIEQRAWESETDERLKKAKRKDSKPREDLSPAVKEASRKNLLYEALGKAFRAADFRDEAKLVAVDFFMTRRGKEVEPHTTALAELFLEKVADMQKQRLDAVRTIADNIADHLILSGNDRRAAWELFRRRLKLGEFLQFCSVIQRKLSDAGHPIEWEDFLLAMGIESEDDRTAADHWLVQELILIRLYERLAKTPVLSELPEPEISGEETSKT